MAKSKQKAKRPQDTVVSEDIASILAHCKEEMSKILGKNLFMTGGSGFVGNYMVKSVMALNLLNPDRPCNMYLPTRDVAKVASLRPDMMNNQHLHWFQWDGNTSLKAQAEGYDLVVHAASPTDPAKVMEDPVRTRADIEEMTANILEHVNGMGVSSFLFLSSGAVYGPQIPRDLPITEDDAKRPDPANPASCYGLAKLRSEELCLGSGLPVYVARLFSFIGPYLDINSTLAAPEFIRQAGSDGRIIIKSDGTPERGYGYASDLAIILWKLLLTEGKKYDIYNVGSSKFTISIKGLADLVARMVGNVKVEVLGKPSGRKGPSVSYVPDISRSKMMHEPEVNIPEALRRTMRSLYARGMIDKPPKTLD